MELSRFGLTISPSPPDGSCLFHSLSLFFADLDHVEMRRQIVQYIADHAEQFSLDIGAEYNCSVETYCQNMAQIGTYGDGIALQAFTILYQVTVWLFMPSGTSKIGEYPKNIALVRRGEHYDAAIPS